MSKIGEKPINIESGVNVTVDGQKVTIKGTGGQVSYDLPKEITVNLADNVLTVARKNENKKTKSLHGLWRSLLSNGVIGVAKSWEKTLEIVGTGYNVKAQGQDLNFKLGYSHPVIFKASEGITFAVGGNNKVTVKGVDKQLVGQVAHQIRLIKKPDVYKGKGIKYAREKLRIKPGKKAKAAGAA